MRECFLSLRVFLFTVESWFLKREDPSYITKNFYWRLDINDTSSLFPRFQSTF